VVSATDMSSVAVAGRVVFVGEVGGIPQTRLTFRTRLFRVLAKSRRHTVSGLGSADIYISAFRRIVFWKANIPTAVSLMVTGYDASYFVPDVSATVDFVER
jgi:hypothetical protein